MLKADMIISVGKNGPKIKRNFRHLVRTAPDRTSLVLDATLFALCSLVFSLTLTLTPTLTLSLTQTPISQVPPDNI